MTLKEPEVVRVKVSELKADISNPNTFTAEQQRALKKSYEKFGILKFLVIDSDNVVIDGHQRLDQLKALGVQEVQAIKVQPKDETERILIRQTLNKLYGTHDRLKDANDFLKVFQSQQLGELAELLARPQEEFQRALEKHTDVFTPTLAKEIDLLHTQNKCPKCGYEW